MYFFKSLFLRVYYLFLVLIFFLTPLLSNGQSNSEILTLPGNGEITLKEVTKDTVYFIPIQVTKLPRSGSQIITLSDANSRTRTADKGKDYDYVSSASTITLMPNSDDFFSVGVKVYSRKIKSDVKSFTLNFTYTENGSLIPQALVVKIEPLVPIIDKKELPDTSKWKMRIVTGSNFDFFDAPTFKNFAGDLNIFIPDLVQFDKKKKISLGIQAGLFNFRYFESDSSRGRTLSDRYLLDQNVTSPTIGATRYINETYALNSKTSFNTVGAYLNPMLSLYNKKWFDMYINLHFEGLWRIQINEEFKIPIRKDTFTLSQNDISQGIVLQNYPGLRPTYTKRSFNDVYIGVGFPIKVDIKKAFEFFVTSTVGLAHFEGLEVTTRIESNIRYRSFDSKTYNKLFLLTKAQLITTVSPIDIALGGEFRRIAGQQTFYAVYLGAALSLDKFKK